jgi:flavin-dependent dehydrogenase
LLRLLCQSCDFFAGGVKIGLFADGIGILPKWIEVNNIKNIAIIGGGPAASTLGILLRRAGFHVAMYFVPERVPVVVGESLVPMIIPMLQDLGVEEEVAAYSVRKPGACFTFDGEETLAFRFADTPDRFPDHAYNVPRKAFNATLRDAARRSGVKLIEQPVELQCGANGSIALDNASLQFAADCWAGSQPDLIVDAAGRARLIGQLLDIPVQQGAREDIALFAHVDRTELIDPGYVHTDRLEHGWCWRIPLPQRVSLGFVVPAAYAGESDAPPEDQFDRLLHHDRIAQKIAPHAKRLTAVQRFKNYQSQSVRWYGENWVMLGDSGGFVDPVFSSGMLIAMDSAYKLTKTLIQEKPLSSYEKAIRQHLLAWFEIVGYYYDGRIMAGIKSGESFAETFAGRLLVPWLSMHIGGIFIGAAATQPMSMNLLRILVKYGLQDVDPQRFSID